MDKEIDDAMKIRTHDYLVITEVDTGKIIEKRNGKQSQEVVQNEER